MAIRTDFTAGEVLAAADLNDTFAAKLNSSAYLSGLELIDGDSWSAVSSVSINNLFTSSYDNYRIIINAVASNGAESLRLRLRASGSDFSSSNYFFGTVGHDSGNSASNDGAANQSSWTISYLDTSHTNITTIDIFRPTTSERKFAIANSVGMNFANTQYAGRVTGLAINTTASADGLTIFVASGTITGTVRSYGYRN